MAHGDDSLIDIHEDERVSTSRTERAAERLLAPFQRFARLQVAGGVLLLLCTVLALVWANSPWAGTYQHLLHERLGVVFAGRGLSFTLHHWINDGLMAIFFFVVGLEIKREFVAGELAEVRKAMLPIAAAVGGMVVPAAIYTGINAGGPGAPGWAIPMATDIAFALGALVLLGSRVPEALKVFLVALAIVDDLGAVLVIAVFYTNELSWTALGSAGVFLAALAVVNLAGGRNAIVYGVLGVCVWVFVLRSGVHATVAGVLVAMTIPVRLRLAPGALSGVLRRASERVETLPTLGPMATERVALVSHLHRVLEDATSLLQRFEHALQPWVTFFIMPVFALFNAGVSVDASAVRTIAEPVPLGILGGLVLGKPVGVFLASWLAVRAGAAVLPAGVSWRQVFGTACLAGIGFTMSLFISSLAFADTPFESQAKLGILLASATAAVVGTVVLLTAPAAREA
jgi:NhaA family Na+:H+ antiporter